MSAQHHVKRTRVADTSVAHEQGGSPSKAGTVAYSKTFPTAARAQREADAWTHSGDFAQHGPSDWTAEVLPGVSPRQPGETVRLPVNRPKIMTQNEGRPREAGQEAGCPEHPAEKEREAE